MNNIYRLLLISFLFLISSCTSKNKIPEISFSDNEIILKNWQLIGPFYPDTTIRNYADIDYLKKFNFSENNLNINVLYREFKNYYKNDDLLFVNYKLKKDFFDLNSIFKTEDAAICYAFCYLISKTEQDVAFLVGSNDGIKLWVNNKLYINEFKERILRKNENIVRVRLKKGKNQVLVKSTNIKGLWQFHLCISSVEYVKRYSLLKDHKGFSWKYLINKDDSIKLKIDTNFISVKKPMVINFYDINDSLIFKQVFYYRNNIEIYPNLNKGIYKCNLFVDNDTLTQYFVFGNYLDIYDSLKNEVQKYLNTEKIKINVNTIIDKIYDLYRFGMRNKFDEVLERKISQMLYKFMKVYIELKNNREPFSHKEGLHLRGFKSKIDSTINYYLIYIPNCYDSTEKIPLIVEVPFVDSRRRAFFRGIQVANIDRIEYLCKLADKYGFAFLLTSSRIYDKYNLSPIAFSTTLETIEEVKKDYNIDEKRMYLYGSCFGGLFALLFANFYPSIFAAIAVEGPELNYAWCEYKKNANCSYPLEWVRRNNIINFLDNFLDKPIYILHSKNDEKADLRLTKKIVKYIKKRGGNIFLDYNNNPSKTKDISMNTENYNMSKVYKFFYGKEKKITREVKFSTAQLKYNKKEWLTILDKPYFDKAFIRAVTMGNKIIIKCKNVNSFLINLFEIPDIDKNKKIKIVCNGKKYKCYFNDSIKIILNRNDYYEKYKFSKNEKIEGPISHFFANSFLILRFKEEPLGINTGESLSKYFIGDWKKNYFFECNYKDEENIINEDIMKYNLLIPFSIKNNDTSNLIINKIKDKIPLKVSNNLIEICGKKFYGENLMFLLIYPNPLFMKRYILIIGTNTNYFKESIIEDLSYKGYFDYEIYDQNTGSLVYYGYFDNYWKLK